MNKLNQIRESKSCVKTSITMALAAILSLTAAAQSLVDFKGVTLCYENAEVSWIDDDIVFKFTDVDYPGMLTLPSYATAWILSVGGGGAGGTTDSGSTAKGMPGGGGAGGFVEYKGETLRGGTYEITVGAGGAAGTAEVKSVGDNGKPSCISLRGAIIYKYTAQGGGGGGIESEGIAGASGGGGSYSSVDGAMNGGAFVSGWGNEGGDGIAKGGGGGGGGAGTPGDPSVKTRFAGNGGDGLRSRITLSADDLTDAPWYAGGGGGAVSSGSYWGLGGRGGGGNGGGGKGGLTAPITGEPNTGGGGGGGTHVTAGAAGGSGVVIIRLSEALAGSPVKPVAPKGLRYTGESQVGVASSLAYELTGVSCATNAGMYSCTATLKPGFVWDNDGSTDPVTVNWEISPALIDKPAVPTLIFNGENQVALVNPNPVFVFEGVGEGWNQTNAVHGGHYFYRVGLKSTNYVWSDADPGKEHETRTIDWFIDPKPITPPTVYADLVYNGEDQDALDVDSINRSICDFTDDSTCRARDVGTYTFTLVLKNELGDDYRWSDGTSGDAKLFQWSIVPVPNEETKLLLDMTVRQRYPWNGLVDIAVTFQGEDEDVANAECLFAATNGTTKAEIPVKHIMQNGADAYADGAWTRRFVWDAKADVGTVKIDDVALTVGVCAALPGVQLWEDGPYWAECNVGASKPEESGYYFCWGDTVGCTNSAIGWDAVDGSQAGFSFGYRNCPTVGKDNSVLLSEGYIDSTSNLVAKYDAATAHLGAQWRMPTDEEVDALLNNCDSVWTVRNGVNGRLVTGRGVYVSKSMFFPAAGYGIDSGVTGAGECGYYWSSSPNSDYSGQAWTLFLNSPSCGSSFDKEILGRLCGVSVRPVRELSSGVTSTFFAMATRLSLDCRGAKVVDNTHPIVYDAAWYADGVTARVTANGEEIASGPAGSCAWTPSSDGVHLLTMNVYNALGAAVGSESVFCLSREDLTDLVIPNGTTEIGDYAFAGGQFTSVTIPPSVTNIGAAAFSDCNGLKTVTVSRRDYDLSVFPEGCQIVYVGGIDISNIEVFSGWPWQEVVIGYTIVGTSDETMTLELTAKDNVSGKTYACKTLEGVDMTPGSHVVKWNASADGAKFKSDDVVFTAQIVHKSTAPLYCVVDLSAGADATSYPVSYLDDVPNGRWTDEYKTTKLVLRRIEAGTFTMGSPSEEEGHEENEALHSVELTKPFYMGVFEVTQKQYQLVMGDNPSAYRGTARPVENVSFDTIRGNLEGKKWPLTNAVDAASFMGKIRARTGLTFDLPTEAQWEYACRAGTTTALNIGKVLVNPKTQDPGMDGVGRYGFNNGYKGGSKDGKGGYDDYHTTVGSYLPNKWGLYDMQGNVQEWCLDWYKSSLGTSMAIDPKGPANQFGSRVLRGGSWSSYAQYCRSAFRMMCYSSSFSNDFSGLRLCCSVGREKNPVAEPFGTNGGTETMSSASIAVDTTFKDRTTFAGPISVAYGSVGAAGCRITANDAEIVNSTANGTMDWLPSAGGEYKLVYSCGGITMESTVIAEELTVSAPVITPSDGSVFKTETCKVTITCATDDTLIFYTKDGSVPKMKSEFLYRGPFEITNTATIVAVALGKNGIQSDYAEATISHVEPEPSAISATARQRYPWNGLVDIIVTLQGTAEDVANAECLFAATNTTTRAEVPVKHIMQNGADTYVDGTCIRRFIWDARADVGAVKIDDVALTVGAKPSGVQLWKDGPYWAECNVGATQPEESGYYFWWGDTVGYKRNADNKGWISVKDSSSFSFRKEDCPTYCKSDSELVAAGYIDLTGNLVVAHDAATTHLGTPWRMPTTVELSSLVRNCETTWTTRNGVYGRLVTGKGNYASNSIFLPAAGYGYNANVNGFGTIGYCWSASSNSSYSNATGHVYLNSVVLSYGNCDRFHGLTVRPLREFTGGSGTAFTAETAHLSLDCRGVKVADGTHPLVYDYDVAWYAGGVAAKITADGKEIATGSAGSGAWTPSSDGVHLLTLNVYNALDDVVGTESVFCLNREDVTELVIPEGTTGIGDYAFAGGQFTSVTIPDSVTSIAPTAFVGCPNLKTITLRCKGVDLIGVPDGCEIVHDIDYRVVFDLTGHGTRIGGGELEQTVHHGSAAGAPEMETESGWEFVRWDNDFSYVTSDMAVKAVWVLPLKVRGVTAQQRYPRNGLVDITVTLQGTAEDVAKIGCTFVATNIATKAAIPVAHITRGGADTYADGVWTRRFVWDAGADVGEVTIDDVALTVGAKPSGVQLWKDGPYWAECNVGATQPEESGYYFWWGDTVGYKRNANDNGWISVKDSTSFSFGSGNCPTYGKDNSQLQSEGYIDSAGNLVAEYDAARVHLGAPWRMPSEAEASELASNCETTWTNRNGVYGRLVTGKGSYATKSIFLPAAGFGSGSWLSNFGSCAYLWLSTPNSKIPAAWGMLFSSSSFTKAIQGRDSGLSVRPVRMFDEVDILPDSMTTHLALGYSLQITVASVVADRMGREDGCVDITVTLQGSSVDVANAECLFAATNGTTGAAIPVKHVTQDGSDTYADGVWTRKFVWDAKADVGTVKIDDVALTVGVRAALPGVQLWEDGPYWAECNVGATKPEESGYYFWWGDTVGYERNAGNNDWISVKDSSSFSFSEENCPTYGKSDSELQLAGYIDATGNLVAAHDAATAHLGAPWRMPTDAEFSALLGDCDTEWTSRNGVEGLLVTGRDAYSSKSVFLPAAGRGDGSGSSYLGWDGRCWSSTPGSDDSSDACYLHFWVNDFRRYLNGRRYYGQSVRPVRMPDAVGTLLDSMTTHLALDCRPLVVPTVEGDEGATVTGDAETGFVVKPSEENTAVEVTIPQGVDAEKVTVEVLSVTKTISTKGARVKIVSEGADITEFLNVPAADGNGVVDLTKATVKEEIVKEAMDTAKGAKIELNAADPKLTTAPTRAGLFYQLREGEALGGMKDGDGKVGDGQPWSPKITVKGGNSAFYSIGVGKGE